MSSGIGILSSPLIPRAGYSCQCKSIVRKSTLVRIRCCQRDTSHSQQQVNLSVLRFTLGIPGLDESYLPRYIGYAFGALLVLNHFVGSESSYITPAQLTSETIGLSLAVFSAAVPYLGKFLKGASPNERKAVPEGVEQIFVMSQGIADNVKEDLAWGTYALLRNTNSISLLICMEDALCIRGYWNAPMDLSNEDVCNWFRLRIEMSQLCELKDTLYLLRQPFDSEVRKMIPDGVECLMVQPIPCMGKGKGFILLASSIEDGFSDKDESWIAAIAEKFTVN